MGYTYVLGISFSTATAMMEKNSDSKKILSYNNSKMVLTGTYVHDVIESIR